MFTFLLLNGFFCSIELLKLFNILKHICFYFADEFIQLKKRWSQDGHQASSSKNENGLVNFRSNMNGDGHRTLNEENLRLVFKLLHS